MRILALFYIAMLSGVMASSPNILLIISDDQSWTDYSFMGHPDIKTPHIDKFAKESVLFKRGYVPTALCRPSLATLLTGHYASTHKITGNDPSPNTLNAIQNFITKDDPKLYPSLIILRHFQNYFQKNYLSHQSGNTGKVIIKEQDSHME